MTTTIPQPWMRSLMGLVVVHASQSWMAHPPTYQSLTMNLPSSQCSTPHGGHYKFVYLPCGLACTQDIFQQMMDQILECCKGIIGIAGDVIIHRHDDKEHDQCLHTLMQASRENGLVFNGEKCAIKQPSIKFFGWIYDKDGTHPDPSKVTAIHNMPAPETPSQPQKFLGMVTYLSPFVPSLSFSAPLHGLLKKDVEFTWNETYQDAFDSIKSLVCSDTTSHYFDICRPVIIQVDASKKGLGTALLQDGCPVAFASKVLTPMNNAMPI